jgi:hypothetical protein
MYYSEPFVFPKCLLESPPIESRFAKCDQVDGDHAEDYSSSYVIIVLLVALLLLSSASLCSSAKIDERPKLLVTSDPDLCVLYMDKREGRILLFILPPSIRTLFEGWHESHDAKDHIRLPERYCFANSSDPVPAIIYTSCL